MTTEIEYCKSVIKSIDDDLVRAQYSLGIYVAARNNEGKVLPNIVDALKVNSRTAPNRVLIFNHIDLIHQQDVALTIVRMMDTNRSTNSFSVLSKKAKSMREELIEEAENQYLQADLDEGIKRLQQEYVKNQKERIDNFIMLEKSLRISDEYKKIKHLRNEVLAHRSTKPRSSKANIEMVKFCLEKLEHLLLLAYGIFLNTDYQPCSGYIYAIKDAEKFWSLITDR